MKLVKREKVNAEQSKTLQNSNIVIDIKSAIIEHPKTSHKLSKTLKQAEKVSHTKGAL